MGKDLVAWCWKAASSDSSNTEGSIPSTVRANTEAGFSIVELNKPNLNTDTFGHGLSSAPEMIILKRTASADDWYVYHKDLGNTVRISLNSSAAKVTGTGVWGSTTPTSSVFTLQNQTGGDHIAYCFHSVDSYSKVGSYTGNGSTSGTIVNTGFEPAFLMIKKTNGTGSWYMYDNKRNPSNIRDTVLQANEAAAEVTNTYANLDFLSNGFQLKTTNAEFNGSGDTYIYLAIAAEAQPAPVLANSFDVVTYTGNGGTQDIEADFKADLIWIKSRDTTENHALFDSVRGVYEQLNSNTTNAEATKTTAVTSFNSNGFSLGGFNTTNTNNEDYVAWCWKAAGIGTINTEGSITSITNANPAAGFSIVKYTGTLTSSGNISVGHGLLSAPELIISKRTDATGFWRIRPFFLNNNAYDYLEFDTGALAQFSSGDGTMAVPTSTTFDNNWNSALGGSGDVIAYCFHSVTGYQKIGSYTGTGSAGNAQNVGFSPRFLLLKRTNSAESWFIWDSARLGKRLSPDLNEAESNDDRVNLLSDGFDFDGSVFNGTGNNYIYLAIA